MSKNGMKWYVLRTIGGKEKQVQEYIQTEIDNGILGHHVSQVLMPTETVYQVKNGKRREIKRPKLLSYILVEANLVGEVAHQLRNTPNVKGFLGGLGNPTPVRDTEVKRLIGNVTDEPIDDEVGTFSIGETVKVIEGPFNGFSGTIQEVNSGKKTLTIMVKVFGRTTSLALSFMQVEKE